MQIMTEFLRVAPTEHVELMRFPCEPREYFACRVLRARKFVLDDALKLAAATAQWRTANKIEQLKDKTPYELMGCLEDEMLAHYRASRGVGVEGMVVHPPSIPRRSSPCPPSPSPRAAKSYFPVPDKEGRPVYIEKTGQVRGEVGGA